MQNLAYPSQITTTVATLFAIFLSLAVNLVPSSAFASDSTIPDHIGEISTQELLENYPSFATEHNRFKPEKAEVDMIKALNGTDVIVLFGTWCHDSIREVPRFLKLLELSQVELESLTLYGIDRRKSDPKGFAEQNGLQYTPTIIVKKGDNEIARMIERPKASLAADLYQDIL